jgi:hypothetical protein
MVLCYPIPYNDRVERFAQPNHRKIEQAPQNRTELVDLKRGLNMELSKPLLLLGCALVLCANLLGVRAEAQTPTPTSTTLTHEGIGEFVDLKHRAPVLSVGVNRTTSGVKLLVDATVENDEYKEYPIRFDFYVNRELISTQLRSKELSGGIGIDIPSNDTPSPFNYSVVATLLTPNRTFTTIINGAVFETDLATKLSTCTYTVSDTATTQTDGSNGSRVYVAKEISTTQSGNEGLTVSFTTSALQDGSEGDPLSVSATLSIAEEKASGTISTVISETPAAKIAVSGTTTSSNGAITSLSVQSTDTFTKLECK